MQLRSQIRNIRRGLRGLGAAEDVEAFRAFIEQKKKELKALVAKPFSEEERPHVEARADALATEVRRRTREVSITVGTVIEEWQEVQDIYHSEWVPLRFFVSGGLDVKLIREEKSLLEKIKDALFGIVEGAKEVVAGAGLGAGAAIVGGGALLYLLSRRKS